MKTKDLKSNSQESILKTQLARALADYDNLRKRTEGEREFLVKFAGQRILEKLLPILDIIESAQKQLSDKGLALAISEFKRTLLEEGLEEIGPSQGDKFDPGLHEAIESLPGGKHGTVAESVLSGWRFTDGVIIRVAKVKVFGGK